MSEVQINEEVFLVDADEWEKTGLWAPGCYHIRIAGIDKKVNEEITAGEFEGERCSYINLRLEAFEEGVYNEEGYYTGENQETYQSRFQKIFSKHPDPERVKKSLKKYKGLCETILGRADSGVKDPVTGKYSMSDMSDSLLNAECWVVTGQFKPEDTWIDFVSYFTKNPVRKIRRD